MPRQPLTVVLGAGFSQSHGLGSTDDITQYLRAASTEAIWETRTHNPGYFLVASLLWKMASAYYDNVNFETILHLAESGLSIGVSAEGYGTDDLVKPAHGAFMDTSPRWRHVIDNSDRLGVFCREGPDRVGVFVHQKMHLEFKEANRDRATAFFARLLEAFDLSIVTLNYDDIAELSLKDGFIDGFQDADVAEFDPKLIMGDVLGTTILHLHGSIRFGAVADGSGLRIVRYRSSQAARDAGGWKAMATSQTQSGDVVFHGPIISGLRKLDKIAVAPFGYYQHTAVEALRRAPRLLIVGYGGRDFYLTNWIQECIRRHGDDVKVAVVTKFTHDPGAIFPVAELLGLTGTTQYNSVFAPVIIGQLQKAAGERICVGNDRCRLFLGGVEESPMDSVLAFLRDGRDSSVRPLNLEGKIPT